VPLQPTPIEPQGLLSRICNRRIHVNAHTDQMPTPLCAIIMPSKSYQAAKHSVKGARSVSGCVPMVSRSLTRAASVFGYLLCCDYAFIIV
jgi:hypothetical protein